MARAGSVANLQQLGRAGARVNLQNTSQKTAADKFLQKRPPSRGPFFYPLSGREGPRLFSSAGELRSIVRLVALQDARSLPDASNSSAEAKVTRRVLWTTRPSARTNPGNV